jgi:putative ABC transport system permease protein
MMAPFSQVNAFRGLPAGTVDILMTSSRTQSQTAITDLSRRIDDTLSAHGIQASVMTMNQIADSIRSRINVLDVMLYAVALIVALIGAIGLFNTLAMSVLERRREIGILRSMGATGRKVAGVFWTEAVSMGILAWLVGVVLGIPAAYGFVLLIGALMIPVAFAFNPLGIVLMLIVIVLIGTVASLIPVWGASHVRIAQTLRYEG